MILQKKFDDDFDQNILKQQTWLHSNRQICQTAVYNSNSKRWESITLEPGKI